LFNYTFMATNDQRLRRLVEHEAGGCCAADVEARLDALDSLTRAVPDGVDADLAAMRALGSDTRYRIVRALDAAEGELCVCEINPLVDVSDSAVSHALSDLHDAGLVSREKRGTWRYYRTTERAEALLDALDATREAKA
jgi:DNA-binding transcriptional ArsR family regulator